MHQPHKLWILATILITWVLLFLTFRLGGLTLERLRPWAGLLVFACLGAWLVLFAMDNARADFVMLCTFTQCGCGRYRVARTAVC
jgi:hypothetical protein